MGRLIPKDLFDFYHIFRCPSLQIPKREGDPINSPHRGPRMSLDWQEERSKIPEYIRCGRQVGGHSNVSLQRWRAEVGSQGRS